MAEERRGKPNGENDISWYTRYPELSSAAASFPYPNRPGMSVPFNTLNDTVQSSIHIPGVMVLDWAPFTGKSELPTDPASVLGKEMYARVRAAYSGTLRADAPDYVVYVMCLDSIFSYIAWLKRLYRALSAYNPANYVIPDVLLSAMGLSAADIQNLRLDKTKLWQLINELVHQSRKFTVPSSMDIMNRHYWMSDNIYMDDNTLNSQIYLFNLRSVYEYKDLQVEPVGSSEITAAGAVLIDLPWVRQDGNATALTTDTLYTFGRSLIDAMVEWDESYTINGYLQRAYEGVPGFVVAELAQEEVIQPVYEPEVLLQIENSKALPYVGAGYTDPMVYIRQNPSTNAIVSDPQIWVKASTVKSVVANALDTANVTGSNPVLSMRSDAPGVIENIIASRLMAYPTSVTKADKPWSGSTEAISTYIIKFDAGTEIPFGWHLVNEVAKTPDDVATQRIANKYHQEFATISTSSGVIQLTEQLVLPMVKAEAFDWHPKAMISFGNSGKTAYQTVFLGDIHNFTAISRADLENLHRICAFSEFNSFTMM